MATNAVSETERRTGSTRESQERPNFPIRDFDSRTVQSVANSIAKMIKGDVLWDDWQRAMYATDASPYEILPLCVVIPRSEDDVVSVVRFAHEQGISVIPRRGGSGLVGGALGSGIVFDFTKYIKSIISIGEDYVICEPGIFRNNFERELEKML
jgi:FAD/FMN-containing dehydrogenase